MKLQLFGGQRQALKRPGRAVVAVHHANNESGVIQPIAEVAALVRAADGWLHVDAIQSAGKIAVDIRTLDADTLTLSAHKLGGPQGVGALVLKAEEDIRRLRGRTALLIASASGVQYAIADSTALDRASRRLLERFL